MSLSSYRGPMFLLLNLDLTPSLWSCQYFHSMYDILEQNYTELKYFKGRKFLFDDAENWK